jgi:hypothetical protein
MLIPNKFNGYQADGCRLLHVGGGVGEAALIGAAMGGGSAALTGGDPLKGALIGGLTGGVGAGLTPAATAATAAPTVAATATPAVLPAGVTAGTLPASALPAAGAGSAGITALPIDQAAANIMAQQPALAATQQTLASTPGLEAGRILENSLQTGLDVGGMNPAQMTSAPMSSFQQAMNSPFQYIKDNPFKMGAAALAGATGARKEMEEPGEYDGPLKRFRYNPDVYRPQFAEGGIASLTSMPVERMSDRNDAMAMMANRGQMYAAGGGISSLGSYSDGGRMLKGPGDGMSDSIPASISNKRPARLADGEFVVPADVVSHLGNGSTDAGARQLYSMMDKVRSARTGTKKQGRQIRPQKMMPA